MGKVMRTVRTKLGLAAVGGALLLAGVGFGAAAVAPTVSTRQVSDVATVTSDPTPTVTEPAPTTAAPVAPVPVVVAQPTVPAPATTSTAAPAPIAVVAPSTVARVTSSTTPTPATATSAPTAQSGIGVTGTDGHYTPAPQVQNPGEPPVAPDPGPPPAKKLPGEAGYKG